MKDHFRRVSQPVRIGQAFPYRLFEARLTLVPSPAGDFDANDLLDATDVDALAFRIRNGPAQPVRRPDAMFDVNGG